MTTKKYYCTGLRVNGSVNNCCHEHDKAYGVNGTGTRYEADKNLYTCLKNKSTIFAFFVFLIVRVFGVFFFKR